MIIAVDVRKCTVYVEIDCSLYDYVRVYIKKKMYFDIVALGGFQMKRISFNEDWYYRHLNTEDSWKHITLPFDAMLREQRTNKAKGIHNIGWFESYDYEYKKDFYLPPNYTGNSVFFEFEGIYHNAEIYINGEKVIERPFGYTQIIVCGKDYLKSGKNEILVVAHNEDQPNSRWYSGSGIYRPVWIYKPDDEKFITLYGMKIRTLDYKTKTIEIKVETSIPGIITADILDENGETVLSSIEAESFPNSNGKNNAVIKTQIIDGSCWSLEQPVLFKAVVRFGKDSSEETFGIRELSLTQEKGLLLNGERIILKGACIHSDNQLLGAEVYPEAEERRIKLLKEVGYNAIRSAHNPASRDLLEACDRLGMLIMDEYTDMWYIHKNKYDYASYMPDWWRQDLKDMVEKDYNHPCVILYSYGNEVAETGQKRGIKLAKEMTDYLHTLDDTRPVTCGINIFFNFLYKIGLGVYSDDKSDKEAKNAGKEAKNKKVGSEFYNYLAGILGAEFMKFGAGLYMSDLATRDAFANMDVAGYNYGITRYIKDLRKYPERYILGSETFCKDAYKFYELAKQHPRIIGDFVWAGMDYIGEAGIGSWEYEDYAPKGAPKEGWLTAGSGRLDLIGKGGGEALYTKIVYEVEKGPLIAVVPVYQTGKHSPSAWKMTDSVESWSWRGCENMKAKVEVYARAYLIRLFLNNELVGCKKTNKCIAKFNIPYKNGTLKAVAYDENKVKVGEAELITAGDETELRLIPESDTAYCNTLTYVRVQFTDSNGIWKPMDHHRVKLKVKNGELIRLGNACPYNDTCFLSDTTKTYYGEALAIVKPDGRGDMIIRAVSDNLESEITIPVI